MSKRSVAPLLIGTFLLRTNSGAGTVVIGLFLAHLSAHLGHAITSLQVGLLAVVYFTTELLLSPIMGALSDRWGRRRFLVIGPILGLTVVTLFLFTPLAKPVPYLIGLQMLSGLASSMQVPAVLSYLADFTSESSSRRMRIMSFYELATSGGIAAGVVVGGFAWDRFERFLRCRRSLYVPYSSYKAGHRVWECACISHTLLAHHSLSAPFHLHSCLDMYFCLTGHLAQFPTHLPAGNTRARPQPAPHGQYEWSR